MSCKAAGLHKQRADWKTNTLRRLAKRIEPTSASPLSDRYEDVWPKVEQPVSDDQFFPGAYIKCFLCVCL